MVAGIPLRFSRMTKRYKGMKTYYVYIMTNFTNTVLYTGITNDLKRRVYEHKNHITEGFTSKYNCTKLVWCETTGNVESAIIKEKQIKGWKRNFKENIINQFNPEWKDLSDSLF